ncbi:MAG: ABC transporter substrate-binding protein, partial [Ralstonia sp.]
MKTLLLKLCAAALVATSAVAANVHAAELHVMSSGCFTAAYKVLGPKTD